MLLRRLDNSHDWRGGLEAGPNYTPAKNPVAAQFFSIILAIFTQILLSVCLTRCIATIVSWKKTPIALWLLLAIYADSFLFVFISTCVRFGIGVNISLKTCQAAILICIIFYLSTKILIYQYFVEKAYLVRGSRTPRLRDTLWLSNVSFAIAPYILLCLLNLIWRIHYIDARGFCIIGMEKQVLWPLVGWEVLINIYLTAVFLGPLRETYAFQTKHAGQGGSKLQKMALRTFIGVCITLTTSVANLSILTVLDGEPGWLCLLICTSDVFVSVMVLHWVAMSDAERRNTSDPSYNHTPLKIKIAKAVTPAKRPSPLPSAVPSPFLEPPPQRVMTLNGFPWEESATVETTISSGHDGMTTSEEGGVGSAAGGGGGGRGSGDGSGIRVKVRHEISETSLA